MFLVVCLLTSADAKDYAEADYVDYMESSAPGVEESRAKQAAVLGDLGTKVDELEVVGEKFENLTSPDALAAYKETALAEGAPADIVNDLTSADAKKYMEDNVVGFKQRAEWAESRTKQAAVLADLSSQTDRLRAVGAKFESLTSPDALAAYKAKALAEGAPAGIMKDLTSADAKKYMEDNVVGFKQRAEWAESRTKQAAVLADLSSQTDRLRAVGAKFESLTSPDALAAYKAKALAEGAPADIMKDLTSADAKKYMEDNAVGFKQRAEWAVSRTKQAAVLAELLTKVNELEAVGAKFESLTSPAALEDYIEKAAAKGAPKDLISAFQKASPGAVMVAIVKSPKARKYMSDNLPGFKERMETFEQLQKKKEEGADMMKKGEDMIDAGEDTVHWIEDEWNKLSKPATDQWEKITKILHLPHLHHRHHPHLHVPHQHHLHVPHRHHLHHHHHPHWHHPHHWHHHHHHHPHHHWGEQQLVQMSKAAASLAVGTDQKKHEPMQDFTALSDAVTVKEMAQTNDEQISSIKMAQGRNLEHGINKDGLFLLKQPITHATSQNQDRLISLLENAASERAGANASAARH